MITRNKKRKLLEISGEAPVGRQPLTKRRQIPEYQLQEFLEREIEHAHMKKEKKNLNEKDAD